MQETQPGLDGWCWGAFSQQRQAPRQLWGFHEQRCLLETLLGQDMKGGLRDITILIVALSKGVARVIAIVMEEAREI